MFSKLPNTTFCHFISFFAIFAAYFVAAVFCAAIQPASKFCWLGFLGFRDASLPGPDELRSSILDRGTLTLTLTLRVNPHRTLETLANKILAVWHTNVLR